LLTGLILACGKNGSSEPTQEARPAETPTPAPTATATPKPAPSVSARPSRWGWKGLRGDFAFFTMIVQPAANPDLDRWTFEIGSSMVQCLPRKKGGGWEFVDCIGLKAGDSLKLTIDSDIDLQIDLTVDGKNLREKLIRVEEKEEPVSSTNVQLLWRADKTSRTSINTGLWAADGVVFQPTSNGTVELLDAVTGARLSTANALLASGGRGPATVMEVTARGGYLYTATTSRGVVIFDVRDPRQPRLVGQFVVDAGANSRESFTNVHTLRLSPDGRTLYAVNQSHAMTDLRIIDVSDPAAPREAGRYSRPEITQILDGFHDIHVIDRAGRRIGFLQSLRSGLFIIDLTDPKDVKALGAISWQDTLSHSGAAFEVGGKLYYAHDDEGFDQGMTILDVSDLANPKVVARYQTRRGTSIHNIEIVNNIAYVSYYVDGLRVIDLRDPARPKEIAHYDTVAAEDENTLFQGAWGIKVLDGRVFISDMQSGTFGFKVDVPN